MAVQPSMPLLPLNADGQGPTFEMATENSSKGKEEMFPFLFWSPFVQWILKLSAPLAANFRTELF